MVSNNSESCESNVQLLSVEHNIESVSTKQIAGHFGISTPVTLLPQSVSSVVEDISSKLSEDFLNVSIPKLTNYPPQIDSHLAESQLSSVHVPLPTQLTLETSIPFSFAANSDVVDNNYRTDFDDYIADDGYNFEESVVYCQCARCATLKDPYIADESNCPNCHQVPVSKKCMDEFGFMCKECPVEDACSCNICERESIKFAKICNGTCFKCHATPISLLCQKRKGICAKCVNSAVATNSTETKVTKEKHTPKSKNQSTSNFNAHYKARKQTTDKSVKKTEVVKGQKVKPKPSTKQQKKADVPPPATEEVESSVASEIISVSDDKESDPAETAKEVAVTSMKKDATLKASKSSHRKVSGPKSVIWTYFKRKNEVLNSYIVLRKYTQYKFVITILSSYIGFWFKGRKTIT